MNLIAPFWVINCMLQSCNFYWIENTFECVQRDWYGLARLNETYFCLALLDIFLNALIHKAVIGVDGGILAGSLWEGLSGMLIENETRLTGKHCEREIQRACSQSVSAPSPRNGESANWTETFTLAFAQPSGLVIHPYQAVRCKASILTAKGYCI